MQPISIILTFTASSHSSQQYLLPVFAGHPHAARAHSFLFSSSAISSNLPIFVLLKDHFFPPFFVAFVAASGFGFGGRPGVRVCTSFKSVSRIM